MPDYTINDAFCDGFETGLYYLIRYAATDSINLYPLVDDEVEHLVKHLSEKKKWRSAEEWEALIRSAYAYGGK
jgi:hypothetical protein